MSDMSSYRPAARAKPARPSIGEIRRASSAAMIVAAGAMVLLIGWGMFELVALIVARFIDHPSAGKLIPSAVESIVRVTHLM